MRVRRARMLSATGPVVAVARISRSSHCPGRSTLSAAISSRGGDAAAGPRPGKVGYPTTTCASSSLSRSHRFISPLQGLEYLSHIILQLPVIKNAGAAAKNQATSCPKARRPNLSVILPQKKRRTRKPTSTTPPRIAKRTLFVFFDLATGRGFSSPGKWRSSTLSSINSAPITGLLSANPVSRA